MASFFILVNTTTKLTSSKRRRIKINQDISILSRETKIVFHAIYTCRVCFDDRCQNKMMQLFSLALILLQSSREIRTVNGLEFVF